MKKFTPAVFIGVLLLVSLLPGLVTGEEEATTEEPKKEAKLPPGQAAFLAGKCNLCHTVVAVGIGEPREATEGDADVVTPPDLSEVGSSREAEWLTLYLVKEETIEGRKHKIRFKGGDENLAVLVDWLVSLKAPGDTLAVEPAPEPAPPSAGEEGQ